MGAAGQRDALERFDYERGLDAIAETYRPRRPGGRHEVRWLLIRETLPPTITCFAMRWVEVLAARLITLT